MSVVAPSQITMLTEALRYAAGGWQVISLHRQMLDGTCTCQRWRDMQGNGPCSNPGKHPQLKEFATLATKDERTLRVWWKDDPLSNLGIIGGNESALWGLDTDPVTVATSCADC